MTAGQPESRYCVYGFFTQRGEPLYVGATTDFARRESVHRQKLWWQNVDQRRTVVVVVSNAAEAALMEARTIDALRPRHNRIRPSQGGYYRGRRTEPQSVRARIHRELSAKNRYAVIRQRLHTTSPARTDVLYDANAFRLAVAEARKLRMIHRAIAEAAEIPLEQIREIAAEAGISRQRVVQIEEVRAR